MTRPTSFRFDKETTELLDELKGDTEDSRASVIRRSLVLMKYLQEAEKQGKKIVLESQDDPKDRETLIVLA